MKKTLAWLFCILMCLSLFPTVHAANPGDIGFETSLALQLKQLGLFRGASEQEDGTADFDLNREPSREEALIMLIRALGKEDKARGYGKTHPFTDVPAWADGYVSYAYENGLTKGVSDTLFGAGDTASAEAYLTFMLRALGYTEGEYGDFIYDGSQALAAWCGVLPAPVDGTDFLRSDVVKVTCAALYASLKGTRTTLWEHLSSEGVFTREQFNTAFPEYPFGYFRLLDSKVSEAIAERVPLGMTDDNVYVTQCHVITEITDADGVLTISVLVCYHDQRLPRDNFLPYWSSSGTVAPWLIELEADTLQPKSCRMAYQLREEGFALTDCFSDATLAALDKLRMPMRDVCKIETQMLLDNGIIAYRQPTYEQALAKAVASFSEVIEKLETEPCTVLLGRYDHPSSDVSYYEVCLIFKPDSAVGEGETETVRSSSQGELRLSEDGLTLYYSYPYDNSEVYEGLPPTGPHALPVSGTWNYTIDLNTKTTTSHVISD